MHNHCESTLNSLQIRASESFRELVAHLQAFENLLGGLPNATAELQIVPKAILEEPRMPREHRLEVPHNPP